MKFSTQGQHMSDERYHLESNSSGMVVLGYDPESTPGLYIDKHIIYSVMR